MNDSNMNGSNMNGSKKYKIRVAVNVFIVVAVLVTWFVMAFFGEGTLVDRGVRSMKYFTLQSNVLACVAAIVWLVKARGARNGVPVSRGVEEEDTTVSRGVEVFKYVAAVAVLLTFTTVAAFLGPLYGYKAMFEGINLWFHLIVPLVAGAEVIFLSGVEFTRRDNRLAMLPPIIYGVGYIANNLINGIGEWPDTNDWYLFLHWGPLVGAVIFVMLCAVTWVLGFVLRKITRRGARREGSSR